MYRSLEDLLNDDTDVRNWAGCSKKKIELEFKYN